MNNDEKWLREKIAIYEDIIEQVRILSQGNRTLQTIALNYWGGKWREAMAELEEIKKNKKEPKRLGDYFHNPFCIDRWKR